MALDKAAIRRGSVVLLGLRRDRARPAVVVRSDLTAGLSTVTVLPIIGATRRNASLRVDIAPDAATGLRAPSQVMVDWPQTLPLGAMGPAIGRLDVATMAEITRQLAVVLGIGGGAGRPRARPAGTAP